MKRKYVLGALLATFLLAAALYFNRQGQAPAGQPPIQNLTAQNVADFKQAFNAGAADVRVLLLLSPT